MDNPGRVAALLVCTAGSSEEYPSPRGESIESVGAGLAREAILSSVGAGLAREAILQ
jgi:hypothetical protein